MARHLPARRIFAHTVLVAVCTTPLATAEATADSDADSLAGIVIGRDWPNRRGPSCNGSTGDSAQVSVIEPLVRRQNIFDNVSLRIIRKPRRGE